MRLLPQASREPALFEARPSRRASTQLTGKRNFGGFQSWISLPHKDCPLLLQRLRSAKLSCNELFVTASILAQPNGLVSTYNTSVLTIFLQFNHAPFF